MVTPKTIVAQATPSGRGSVAIVRISGTKSFDIAKKIGKIKEKPKHLKAFLGFVFNSKGEKFDRVMYLFFEGPNSYTGENVVEISCHGNQLIVEQIIERAMFFGATLPEPGEFTKRSFLNGKMSLSQAESVGLLISSRSKEAAQINLENSEGLLSKNIENLKGNLIKILGSLEFDLDISEEEEPNSILIKESAKSLKNNHIKIGNLLSSSRVGVKINTGVRVAIVGKPNVGKSTLMNLLAGSNKSITSPKPGTTRDVIACEINVSGYPVTIVDTAGIRQSKDSVEGLGIERTLKEVERASIVLSLYTSKTKPVDNIDLGKQIMVQNKVDLQKKISKKNEIVYISALKGVGLSKLFSAIEKKILSSDSFTSDTYINTKRQEISLGLCQKSVGRAHSLLNKNPALELVAYEIKTAISHLDSFLGKTTAENVLDQVFSSFCVGK